MQSGIIARRAQMILKKSLPSKGLRTKLREICRLVATPGHTGDLRIDPGPGMPPTIESAEAPAILPRPRTR